MDLWENGTACVRAYAVRDEERQSEGSGVPPDEALGVGKPALRGGAVVGLQVPHAGGDIQRARQARAWGALPPVAAHLRHWLG